MLDKPAHDRLAGTLKPVRPRGAGGDALIMAALCGVELALFLGVGLTRPDMSAAMAQPSFWWKLVSLGLIAFGGAVTAILSFDPVASPRRGLRRVAAIAVACLAAGWFIDAARDGMPALIARLNWLGGLQCVYSMVVLSLPPIVGLGLLMRRGAPTEPGGTALAIGAAAAAWGAFVFVFACPYDDPFYIAVWYSAGCGIVTALARWLLPRLTRW